MRRVFGQQPCAQLSRLVRRPTTGLASSDFVMARFQSQGGKNFEHPFIEGELRPEHSSEHHRRTLNPATMAHHVRAKIQQSRRELGLTEVVDWDAFCQSAVYIPTAAGALWVGEDDPRAVRFMRRKEKHKKNPLQIAMKNPEQDAAKALEEHPLRKYFSTACDLKDPMSVATGMYHAGMIKEYDIKHTGTSVIKYVPRRPTVAIMGHVDHGKTTLLDYLRKTRVAAGEAGGITQRIGAFTVKVKGDGENEDLITFIDTPGHQAFIEMRQAGIDATDVVVLIVSVTDGVQPQTREVIQLVKKNKVPMVVAINKIDRQTNTDEVMKQLREEGVDFEEDGGDTMVSKIAAIDGTGVQDLLEQVSLVAELSELVVPTPARAEVIVTDSNSEKWTNKPNRGKEMVVYGIVRSGVVKKDTTLAGGVVFGTVSDVTDEHDQQFDRRKGAGVGSVVKLHGFKAVPKPGTILYELSSWQHGNNHYKLMRDVYTTEGNRESALQILKYQSDGNFFIRKPDNNQIRHFNSVPYHLIVKAETFGQLQALMRLINDLPYIPGIELKLRNSEVGGLDDYDVVGLSAMQQQGCILCFGKMMHRHQMEAGSHISIFHFDVVYHGVDHLKQAMVALLPKPEKIRILGTATVQQTFRASQSRGGNAGGLIVNTGTLSADALVRVKRPHADKEKEPDVVYEGRVKQLRRFKDEVPTVEEGLECGLILDDQFVFRTGDIVESIEKYFAEHNVDDVFEKAKAEEDALIEKARRADQLREEEAAASKAAA